MEKEKYKNRSLVYIVVVFMFVCFILLYSALKLVPGTSLELDRYFLNEWECREEILVVFLMAS